MTLPRNATASSTMTAAPDQADQFQRGEQGFSRVFHAIRIKIFTRHLQFGIFGASWKLVAKSGTMPEAKQE